MRDELELENGKILKITGNHKIKLTSGKWVRVDELLEDDDICTECMI
jgi:intein/homing endonuclease